jgi:hypothetical protein
MMVMVNRKHFGPEGYDHNRLRRSVLDLAIMGFQDHLVGLRGDLVRVMDSPNFTDDDRTRIRRAMPMEMTVRG